MWYSISAPFLSIFLQTVLLRFFTQNTFSLHLNFTLDEKRKLVLVKSADEDAGLVPISVP